MERQRHFASLLAALTIWSTTSAQAQPVACLDDGDLKPWLSAITSNFVDGGATEDGMDGYWLCSTAPGPGPELDSQRLLVQSVSGDFSLEVTLESLSSRGSGGLAVTLPGLELVSAPRLLVWVEANHPDSTTGQLHSSLRRENGETAEAEPPSLAVSLPLRLKISRTDGVLTTAYLDMGMPVDHFEADVAAGSLGGEIRVGMTQFSGSGHQTRFAHFEQPELLVPDVSDVDCVEGDPLLGHSPLIMTGKYMDLIESAFAFGQRADILEQTGHHLMIQPATLDGGVNYGKIELFSAASRDPQSANVAAIGKAFIRGDADQDGDVDQDDRAALEAWLLEGRVPACPGAGDVDGDEHTDLDDLAYLDNYLNRRGLPPAAPFPEPGYVPGAQTCGAPGSPDLRSSRPSKSAHRRPLREGDIIDLTGRDLPPPATLAVWFGDVRTRVLGGDDKKISVKVGHVPSDGHRCARIIDVAADSQNGTVRIGGGWLARDDDRKLCHDFQASPEAAGFSSSVNAEGQLVVPIPRAGWRPGQMYDIQASAFLPWLDGLSQGSRELRMTFLAPRGGRDEYMLGLESLAAQMTAAMNGGYLPTTPCDCEVEVQAVPQLEQLILAPCFPPPPKPEPVVPGPNQWQAPPPDLVGGINILPNNPPPVECDGGWVSHKDEPRRAAWCHFEDVVQPMSEDFLDPPSDDLTGHPEFASWYPLSAIVSGPSESSWKVDPDEQPLSQKHILFEPGAKSDMLAMGYTDPHVWALRGMHCSAFESNWMPKINFGHRVAKTFFLPESLLPSSINPNGLYSYIPPCPEDTPNCNNERAYLVGLHLAISTLHDYGTRPEGYFWWATFWVPAAINDTQTKSGADLKWTYSPNCVVGNGVDRPMTLPPPWDRFVMCTDADPNHLSCGNPYAFGECPLEGGSTSCKGCHEEKGFVKFNSPGVGLTDRMEMAWLPSVALALNDQELDAAAQYAHDHPGEFTWWTEPRQNPNDPNSDPVACLRADPNIWNPFDPQAMYPEEGAP